MNSVRIIGGEWRRSLLHFPDAPGLRPTPDRVRETLFNWLGQDLSGQTCLDLFAGSGALGFEAASRGALKTLLVDRAAKTVEALRNNALRLGGGTRLEIAQMDALECLASTHLRFDVVFLDPPFRQAWIDRLAQALLPVLNTDAAVYVEAECPITAIGPLKTIKQGRAGAVHFHLLRQDAL